MHHQVCTNCLTCFEGNAPEPLPTTEKRDNNSLENIHGIHLMRDWYLLSMSEEYDKAENENVQKSLKLHRSENIVVAGTLLSLIDPPLTIALQYSFITKSQSGSLIGLDFVN